jgi:hypothetical protein
VTVGFSIVSVLALGVFLVSSGPMVATAEARTATTEASARFERSYRYSGGEAGKKAIEAAVEETVRKMNPLIRSIARRRMLEANAVIPELGFKLSGDMIVASYVGGRIVEAPADGRAVSWTDQFGDAIRVSHRLRGDVLVQTMVGSKGDRRNHYQFADDGQTMTMSVEIRSDKLPAPLRYSVTYRRTN